MKVTTTGYGRTMNVADTARRAPRRLVPALVGILIAAGACSDDGDGGSTTVDAAAQALVGQGSVGYRLSAVSDPGDDQARMAPDAANLAALTPLGGQVRGSTGFGGAAHEAEIEVGGVVRTVVRQGDGISVEAGSGADGELDWVSLELDSSTEEPGLLDVITIDALLALHDPGSVVTSLVMQAPGAAADPGSSDATPTSAPGGAGTATTTPGGTAPPPGPVTPDAGGAGQPHAGVIDADGYALVTLQRSDIQDPFLAAVLDRAGVSLIQVHVWYDARSDDGRVERMAYDLRDLVSLGSQEGAGDGTEAGGLPGTGLHDAGGVYLVVEFLDANPEPLADGEVAAEGVDLDDVGSLLAVELLGGGPDRNLASPSGTGGESPDLHQTPANSDDAGQEAPSGEG